MHRVHAHIVHAHTVHAHVVDWLEAYLDGELSPARRQAVEAHLAGCAECQLQRDELRSLSALLQSWPRMSSSRPPRRFLAELRRSAVGPPAPFGLQQALGWAWRAAPLALLLALVMVYTLTSLATALAAVPGVELAARQGAAALSLAPPLADLAGDPLVGLGVDVIGWFFPLHWSGLTGLAAMAAIGLLYLAWLASWWVREVNPKGFTNL